MHSKKGFDQVHMNFFIYILLPLNRMDFKTSGVTNLSTVVCKLNERTVNFNDSLN